MDRKPSFSCVDCGVLAEWYMLEACVWLQAMPDYHARKLKAVGGRVYLCLLCVEGRLHRRLAVRDFTPAPVNELLRWGYALAKEEALFAPTPVR